MKKHYYPIVFCLFFLLSATHLKSASTGDILGQIVEKETMKPVAYAEIVFESSMEKVVVSANEYGYYYASHLPTGKYQMRVSYNNRTFFMNKVRVYDSYSSSVDLVVSNNNNLPELVEVTRHESVINPLRPHDIVMAENGSNQPTRSLGEALMSQPGVDIVNGQLIIKGSNKVRFFVDGEPVLQPPVFGSGGR